MSTRVIVSGLLRDGLGLAESARAYADAFAAAGYEVRQHVITLPDRDVLGDPGPSGLLSCPEVDDDAEADVVLTCLNPPELAVLRARRGRLPRGRVNVSSWAWEVDPLPASWADETERLDEVWVPSAYVAGIAGAAIDVPVATVAPPVRLPAVTAGGPPPDATRFLALADAASGLQRKNLQGTIAAFARAFEPGEGPELVVKVWNSAEDPAGVEALVRAAAARPDIRVIDRWLDRVELTELLQGSACLVSLHRAEGFGIPIFEALALGVPVLASDFSGGVDRLDDTTAHLVTTRPATVPDDAPPYPAGATWGEPDADHAVEQLRAIWHDRDDALARARRGQSLVRRTLSADTVGAELSARLEPILARNRSRPARSVIRPFLQVVVGAAEPWPSIEPFLRAVAPEIEAVGGDVLLGVRDAAVLPDAHRPPWASTHPADSTNPFVLRAAALDAADADLVVVTEDHCVPHPGWLATYEKAAVVTRAPVLAGSVTNGSPATAADWANYLIGFAAYAPPLTEIPTDRCPTIANCAVPREVLRDARPVATRAGWFERDLVAELWRVGGTVLVPDATVAHTQSFPAWQHLRNHFDDARCAGAHAASSDPAFRPGLAPTALSLVSRTFLRGVVVAVAPRPDLIEPHRRARHWLRALAGARAIGLALGARFGAGRSGDRLD